MTSHMDNWARQQADSSYKAQQAHIAKLHKEFDIVDLDGKVKGVDLVKAASTKRWFGFRRANLVTEVASLRTCTAHDFFITNADQRTALHIAAGRGDISMVKAIIKAALRHSVNLATLLKVKDGTGSTATQLASFDGSSAHMKIVKLLDDTLENFYAKVEEAKQLKASEAEQPSTSEFDFDFSDLREFSSAITTDRYFGGHETPPESEYESKFRRFDSLSPF